MARFRERLASSQNSFIPLLFPMNCLHDFGGFCHAVPPGILIGVVGMSGGMKCVTGDTLIPTLQGLVPIKSLKPAHAGEGFTLMRVGVQSPDGLRFTSHFYDSGEQPTLKMTTRFGYEVTGTTIHPLLTLTPDGCFTWKSLAEIQPGDYVAVSRQKAIWGNQITLPEFHVEQPKARLDRNGNANLKSGQRSRVNLPTILDEHLAYILGVLVGDGGLTHKNYVNLTSADPEIVETVKEWVTSLGLELKHRGRYDYTIASLTLQEWLASLGVKGYAHEKTVPAVILQSPEWQVRAFLRGLFDTDGTGATKDKACVQLCTSSPELAKQVQLLLLQFGIISKRVFYPNKHRGAWFVVIRGEPAHRFYERIGFSLPRKQATKQHLRSVTGARGFSN
jgi:intein/homing endonuclease